MSVEKVEIIERTLTNIMPSVRDIPYFRDLLSTLAKPSHACMHVEGFPKTTPVSQN